MSTGILASLQQRKRKNQKSFAVLVDPDKATPVRLANLLETMQDAQVDFVFVGGSLVVSNRLDETVLHLKKATRLPIVLFPGSPSQISKHADGLLYLSLISGRNPELLIGQIGRAHV